VAALDVSYNVVRACACVREPSSLGCCAGRGRATEDAAAASKSRKRGANKTGRSKAVASSGHGSALPSAAASAAQRKKGGRKRARDEDVDVDDDLDIGAGYGPPCLCGGWGRGDPERYTAGGKVTGPGRQRFALFIGGCVCVRVYRYSGNDSVGMVDLPIDPNEPVYCMCKQVAFGNMIACDNPQVLAWCPSLCMLAAPHHRTSSVPLLNCSALWSGFTINALDLDTVRKGSGCVPAAPVAREHSS
jgi:hypothetical protein